MNDKLLKGAGWTTNTVFIKLRFRNFIDKRDIYSVVGIRIKLKL